MVLASCGPAVVLDDVPRDRTLILMNGGPNQYSLFDNQNPYIPGSDQGFHMGTLPAMFEPLIMYNVLTGEYENWLAESWEYDDSFTALTVKIREGIEWADGVPFTAHDVAFTFDMLRDHAEAMVHLADLPEFFDSTEVVDDHTVRLLLKKAGPAFWATTLSSNHGIFVLPEHIWKDQDPLEFTFHDIDGGLPLGTGPYRLVYASPYQKIYDLREDWWGAKTGFKRLPRIQRIIYVPQQEESQAAQLLLTDQLDMAPIMQVLTLESVLERNARVVTFADRQPPYGYLDWCPIDLNMNCSEPPFDDPQIRRAISMAIDREKLVQLAESGAGVVALHPFTPYEWFAPFDEALQEILARHGYDAQPHLEEVDRIMEGKGYRKDEEGLWVNSADERVEIAMYVPQWLRAYGPPLTQQLRDAGFDANFDTSPGLTSLVQTGEQKASLGCKGPSGVRGMDPYSDAVLLHLAVLPAHGTASAAVVNHFALAQRGVRPHCRAHRAPTGRRRGTVGAVQRGDGDLGGGVARHLLGAANYPLSLQHHPLDWLAEPARPLRLPALLAVGIAEDLYPAGACG